VIAAYDQNGITLVTPTLQPRQIVLQSLEITRGYKDICKPGALSARTRRQSFAG